MSNMIHYKGYQGTVQFSEEDEVFHGKIMGIKSLITFEGTSVKELIQDAHNAIDEYLEFCTTRGIKPEQPFKGSFNIRIHSDIHRMAALLASSKGLSLNSFVEEAIRNHVEQSNRSQNHL